MSETQNIGINLDSKSVDILKKVDVIFRDSIINIGIRMVENTELFDTISGKKEADLSDMASLDSLIDEPKVQNKKVKKEVVAETKAKAPTQSWDKF